MKKNGWIRLYRKSIENPLFQKPFIWHYFTYCLLKACHRETRIIWSAHEVLLERGEFITGRNIAAKETGLSERNIRTAQRYCINLKMIEKSTSKTTSKYTVLRVCNYDAYNSVDTEADQQTSQQATSKRPASDHIQECKEYKENKKTLVKQSLTKKPLPLSPLQILWNSESVSLPKVKSNSKQRQSKECRRLKERSFEDWKIIFRRINETPFLFGGGESGWKATYDWIMKNEIHSTRVLESAYGEPVGKKVKKLVI